VLAGMRWGIWFGDWAGWPPAGAPVGAALGVALPPQATNTSTSRTGRKRANGCNRASIALSFMNDVGIG
jgi:hypothetical protein